MARDTNARTSKHLRARYAAGRWFMVSRDMLAAFTIDQALVLSYLCNICDQAGTDWFRCSREKMLFNLRITRHTQTRILKQLTDLGVIVVQLRKQPAKRYIKINLHRLDALVAAGIKRFLDTHQA